MIAAMLMTDVAMTCTLGDMGQGSSLEPGSMVLTSSTSGLYGNFGQTNYGAAKAGIYGMVRVMSIEGRKYNIRVMGLAPGAYTRMTSDLPGRRDARRDHARCRERSPRCASTARRLPRSR